MPRKTPPVPDGTKWCPRCRAARPRLAFAKSADRKDGLCSRCRSCVSEIAALKKLAAGPCSVPGCERRARCRGMCRGHHKRVLQSGDVLISRPLKAVRPCSIEGCDSRSRGHNLCTKHLYRMKRHGDPLKTVNAPRGAGSVTKKGYRVILRPGHPNAQSARGSIHEHRFLMAESLGRPLRMDEEVHHKNGQKADNRLVRGHETNCPNDCCNLELWSRAQPSGQRVDDKVAWAIELLRLYRPEVLRDQAPARYE